MTTNLKLAIAAGALLAAFLAGWTANGWRLAGTIEHLQGVVATQKQSIDTLDGANKRCAAGVADVKAAVQGYVAASEARSARAAEAMRAAERAAAAHLKAAKDALSRPAPKAGEECATAAAEASQYAQKRRSAP